MLCLVKGEDMKKNKFKLKNKKRGSATTESVLLIAIVVVILITVFFPSLKSIITLGMNNINVWFSNSLVKIGMA